MYAQITVDNFRIFEKRGLGPVIRLQTFMDVSVTMPKASECTLISFASVENEI